MKKIYLFTALWICVIHSFAQEYFFKSSFKDKDSNSYEIKAKYFTNYKNGNNNPVCLFTIKKGEEDKIDKSNKISDSITKLLNEINSNKEYEVNLEIYKYVGFVIDAIKKQNKDIESQYKSIYDSLKKVKDTINPLPDIGLIIELKKQINYYLSYFSIEKNEISFEMNTIDQDGILFRELFKSHIKELGISVNDDDISKLWINILFNYSMLKNDEIIKSGILYAYKNVSVYDVTDLYLDKNNTFDRLANKYCQRFNTSHFEKKYKKENVNSIKYYKLGRSFLRPRRDQKEILKYNKSCHSIKYKIKYLQLEVSDGSLSNIYISGNINGCPIDFTNTYTIPFSTKRNYSKLYKSPLYNVNSKKDAKIYLFDLSEFMNYVPNLGYKSMDYSPADGVYSINFKQEESDTIETVFFKEPTSKLIKIKVFSDFVGFSKSEPNGLIQTEISKPIFLNCNYSSWISLLRYTEPKLLFSKLDNDNKNLALLWDTANNINTLDIYKYANRSIGTTLNVIDIVIPRFKAHFEFNYGIFIYRTGFENKNRTNDSTYENVITNYNSFNHFFELRVNFMPDSRWGLSYGFKIQNFRIWANENKIIQENGKRYLSFYSPYLLGYFRPNDTNEFYFRAELNRSYYTSDNFMQLQIGYSYFFTKKL
ncbi:MAG: hypothetical protein M0R21_08845 [Lentimicrobiaceae bacterium]|nr:hypothetical protein [Lentimicrobiaceae bacterium]